MKVRYVGQRAGYSPVSGKLHQVGDVTEVPNEIGKKLIASGQFKLVREKKKKEEEPTAEEVSASG